GLLVPHERAEVGRGRGGELRSAESAAFAHRVDGIAGGMFLVDACGRIVHANTVGQAILADRDFLSAGGGRLVAGDSTTDRQLRDAFSVAGGRCGNGGIARAAPPPVARDGPPPGAPLPPLPARRRPRPRPGYPP